MDVANELLDAIEIIVDKKIRENTAQIYFGVCKGVSGDSCVMSINGKNNTIHFYGSVPVVGLTYRVFVPNGNMSMAFAITGNDDRKGLYYSNPNLLDNWYFGNPVNQRGVSYGTEWGSNTYGLDRWAAFSVGIYWDSNGYIVFPPRLENNLIYQRLEKSALIVGSKITLSLLTDDGNLIFKTVTYTGNTIYGVLSGTIFGNTTIVVTDDYVEIRIWYTENNTSEGHLTAAKLELGSQQTLAHQDENGNWVLNEIPDYGEQLARCQRYFQLYSAADKRLAKAVDCRPVMRADPSQGTIIIDGTTYYYNTADL